MLWAEATRCKKSFMGDKRQNTTYSSGLKARSYIVWWQKERSFGRMGQRCKQVTDLNMCFTKTAENHEETDKLRNKWHKLNPPILPPHTIVKIIHDERWVCFHVGVWNPGEVNGNQTPTLTANHVVAFWHSQTTDIRIFWSEDDWKEDEKHYCHLK